MTAQAVKKTLSIIKKYGPYIFLPVFLIIAYNYCSSLYPQYKVTAKVAVKGTPAETFVNAVKSKQLVQKTLDQLPFQASFFNTEAPKVELYGDSVPVKFTFARFYADKETSLQLELADYSQFILMNVDTAAYHKFNESIDEPYGKFTVSLKPGVVPNDQTYIVKLSEPVPLLNQFYNGLHVESNQRNDVVSLSITTGNAKKGADFLDRLLQQYSRENHKQIARATPVRTVHHVVIKKPENTNNNIAELKEKAARLNSEIAELRDKAANLPADKVQRRRSAPDNQQAKIYEAVKPYMKKPVDQFVQVPYVDEIEDPELNDQVNEYNEVQLSKQHLISAGQNHSQVDSVNKKLMVLQSNIMEKISKFLRGGSYTTSSSSADNIAELIRSKEHSLADVNKDIQAGTNKHPVVQVKTIETASPVVASSFVIVEKPEDNIEYIQENTFLVYALAVLAGLLLPLAAWSMRYFGRNRPYGLFNVDKLSEKITNLFAAKQID